MGLFELFGRSTKDDLCDAENDSSTIIQVGDIDFEPVQLQDSRLVTNIFYDINDDKKEVVFRQSFLMHNDYKRVDIDIGELDASFVYAPGDNKNDIKFDDDKMTICIGVWDKSYKIVNRFEETAELPEYVTLYRLHNSKAVYKTIITDKNLHRTYIEYHFRRGFDKDLYSQMQLIIPERLAGSESANEAERILDQLVSTYSEEIISDE